MRFENKVAIVTGSGGGIGQAYAEALAREGAAVVVADINTAAAEGVAKQMVADIVKGLPLSRMGTPEDLVGMCLFLFSGEASWTTGQIFNVGGGQVIRS